MKKLSSGCIGIAQGSDILFADFADGGDMWTGTGHRERRKKITFDEPFTGVPVVHCSLTLWDLDSTTNARADVESENITETGFDLVFRTWGDTRVARARVGWIAIGAVRDDDDWDVS